MKGSTELFKQIISIINNEELIEWKDCHNKVINLLQSKGYNCELITEEITNHYFNSCEITYFKFADFCYNYLEKPEKIIHHIGFEYLKKFD